MTEHRPIPNQVRELSELELAMYGELGEWFDKYDRHFVGTREHQWLAVRLAKVAKLMQTGDPQ